MRGDAVVIGSGMVGAAVARELCLHRLDVIVVEAGGAKTPRPGDHLRNGERDAARFRSARSRCLEPIPRTSGSPRRQDLPAAVRVRAVGGTGIVWSAVAPRLRPAERPSLLDTAAWDRLYERAERLLGVVSAEWTPAAAALAGVLAPAGRFRAAPMAARKSPDGTWSWSAPADLLFGEPPLRLLAEHTVVRLRHSGGLVSSAEARSGADGSVMTLEADVWIVAAGPIGNAQLLAASGMQGDGTVGRWLTEHLLAHAIVEGRPGACDEAEEAGPFLERPASDERPFHALVLRDACDERLLVGADPRRTLHLFWYGRMEAQPENRVVFGPAVDAAGLPLASFQVRRSREDEAQSRRLLRDLAEAAPRLGRPLPGAPPQLLPPGSAQHILGTTRLAATADDGVADAHGRVWGFGNLYVAGTSAIPGATTANPTLTAVALGLRAADAVAARSAGRAPLPARA
jgi:choline dehydrogenase-like flavoprotein